VLEFLEGINRKTDGRLQTLQGQCAATLAQLQTEALWHQVNELMARYLANP
jgi:hypothetical protein